MSTLNEREIMDLVDRMVKAYFARHSSQELDILMNSIPFVDYYETVAAKYVEAIKPGLEPRTLEYCDMLRSRTEGLIDRTLSWDKYPDMEPRTIRVTDREIKSLTKPISTMACSFSFYLRMVKLNPGVLSTVFQLNVFYSDHDRDTDVSMISDEMRSRFCIDEVNEIGSSYGIMKVGVLVIAVGPKEDSDSPQFEIVCVTDE